MDFQDPYLIIGIVGMICILAAFLLNQMNKWSSESLSYDTTNALGSLLLVIYALDGKAWPFVILNGVWLIYSLKDVVLDLQKKK